MRKISFILNMIMAVAICYGCDQQKSIDGFERIPSPMEDPKWTLDSISIEDPDLSWINLQDCRVAPTELLIPIQDSDKFEFFYLGGDTIEVVYSDFDLGTGHFRVDYILLSEMLRLYIKDLDEGVDPEDSILYTLPAVWATHITAVESNPNYQEPIYEDMVYGSWVMGDTLVDVTRPSSLCGVWEIDDIFYTSLINDFSGYEVGDSVEIYAWESFFRDHVIY